MGETDENKIHEYQIPGSKTFVFCFEWFELVAQSLIIVAFTFVFLFRIFTVDGDSMLNTLHNGDRIFVQRFSYTPRNGDVVVVRQYNNMHAAIIKRVIAIGGQRLSIDFTSGRVKVNDQMTKESYIKERMRLKGDADIPEVVPENHCFVMGDNRNNSADSRFSDLGVVPYDYIVGRAVFVYFPFYRIGGIQSIFEYAKPGEENGVPDVAPNDIYDQSSQHEDDIDDYSEYDDFEDPSSENP